MLQKRQTLPSGDLYQRGGVSKCPVKEELWDVFLANQWQVTLCLEELPDTASTLSETQVTQPYLSKVPAVFHNLHLDHMFQKDSEDKNIDQKMKQVLDDSVQEFNRLIEQQRTQIEARAQKLLGAAEESYEAKHKVLQTKLDVAAVQESRLSAREKELNERDHELNSKLAKFKSMLTEFLTKKEKFEKEVEKMAQQNKMTGSKVELNVGGVRFTTSISTLTKEEGSLLQTMFKGQHSIQPDADGSYFIDRDGTNFRHVLNFLRDGPASLQHLPGQDQRLLSELRVEAEYYQLHKMADILRAMMSESRTDGQTPGAGSELDSSRMKDCIALALSGGTHGTHMDVRPQAAKEGSSQGRINWDLAAKNAGRKQSESVPNKESVCKICADVDPSAKPTRRRRHQDQQRPWELETSPPEHTKQLQAYRQRLDKWVAESEAKTEQLEQQRLALTTELRVTREALQIARKERDDEKRSRRLADLHVKEVEEKLQHLEAAESQVAAKEEHIKQLERQCSELEEQMEKLYSNNIITPRETARESVDEQKQLRHRVDQLESELEERECDIEEMENEMANLSMELRKVKKDQRDLAEENAMLQKQHHSARDIVQELAGLLYVQQGHLADNNNCQELSNLAETLIQCQNLGCRQLVILCLLAGHLSTMTDAERDQIDNDAQQIIKTCRETIHRFRVEAEAQPVHPQVKEHRAMVIFLIDTYLKGLGDHQTTPKSVLRPQSVELADRPSYEEEDTDISPEEAQMFEQENKALYEEMNSMAEDVRQIEGKVVEIAKLQEIFTEKVLEQAIKKKAEFRVWVLFFLVVCSFSLLFLDWYNG
nr:hypothetical protein BaRGS_029200 [Batillaria attramentaria]